VAYPVWERGVFVVTTDHGPVKMWPMGAYGDPQIRDLSGGPKGRVGVPVRPEKPAKASIRGCSEATEIDMPVQEPLDGSS
jgi:hypothetical protein